MANPIFSRRTALLGGLGSFAGALASRLILPAEALADPRPLAPKAGGHATSCIVLWLNGGPSQIDTFDPKPGSKNAGSFKAIKTRIKGVEFSEHLPQLAAEAHRMAVLRGMTSKEGNHQRARYLLHTGYAPNPTVLHPSLGGWVSEEIGSHDGDLPAFVSIGGQSQGAGFLGVQHGPFFVPRAAAPQNTAYPRNVDDIRFDRRKAALDEMESHFLAESGDPQVQGRRDVYAQTIRMMRSPKLKVFDVSDEPEKVKKAYGDTDFGRGCLAARRLVESGVKLVEVVLDGWDTHKDGFTKIASLSQALDSGMAALLRDLDDRKQLASTLVLCLGEFGRTPRVNENDGRDHYPQAWSALVAGGGIRGGQVHGQTDADGVKVVEKATTVPELFATVVTQLGIKPDKSFSTPSGRPITITDAGTPIKALIG